MADVNCIFRDIDEYDVICRFLSEERSGPVYCETRTAGFHHNGGASVKNRRSGAGKPAQFLIKLIDIDGFDKITVHSGLIGKLFVFFKSVGAHR